MTPSPAADSPEYRIYSVLRSGHTDFSISEIAAAIGERDGDVTGGIQALVEEGRASVLPNGLYLSDTAAARLRDTARRLVGAYHKQNPLRRAMPREILEAPLQKAAKSRDYGAILEWLTCQGVILSERDKGVRLPDHRVEMPIGWRRAAEEIRAVYAAAGLQPPAPDNFQANYPRDVSVPGILAVLVETGELTAIADRLYVSSQAVEEAKDVLRRLAASSEGITVGGVRNATGASRRIILPLLEYFDAQGITRRSGESRVLTG